MRKTVFLICIITLLFACGKTEVKQESQESKISLEAFTLAETLRTAFLKEDRETITRNTTEEGFRNIMAEKRPFDSVQLTFTPRWIEIDKNNLLMNITWKSTWTISGKTVTDRGMAVFECTGTPLKVSRVLRANPFVFPDQ